MSKRDFTDAQIFVIGTSAGGVDILNSIMPSFKKNNKFKVCVVIHLSPSGPNLIPSLLAPNCSLSVSEAQPGEELLPDHIYIAPPDYHLCLEPNKILTLSSEEPVNFSRPSIDILFESAAYAYGKKVVAILLTGANNDGAKGLKMIQDAGGITIVQAPSDAEFPAMPQSALDIMKPDYILTTEEIKTALNDLSSKGSWNA